MAITTKNVTGTKPYTVLRAICMAGERVEVGDSVELTITQYTELASAGKVGPLVEKTKAKKETTAEKKAREEADAGASADAEAEAAKASASAIKSEEPAA